MERTLLAPGPVSGVSDASLAVYITVRVSCLQYPQICGSMAQIGAERVLRVPSIKGLYNCEHVARIASSLNS